MGHEMPKRFQIQRRSSVRPEWQTFHELHSEDGARAFLAEVRAMVAGRHRRLNVEFRLIDAAA